MRNETPTAVSKIFHCYLNLVEFIPHNKSKPGVYKMQIGVH